MTDTRTRENPFSDRHSQLNCSIRYENLLPRRRVESFADDHCMYRPIPESREYHSRSNHYESCESDDDEDLHHSDYRYWKGRCAESEKAKRELERTRREMDYKYRELRKRYEYVCEDRDIFRANYERNSRALDKLQKSYKQDQQKLAVAMKENERLREAGMHSHNKIMALEERLSRLECPGSSSLSLNEDGISGAGEALCDHNDSCNHEMVNSSTPSISMFQDAHIESEQDEVRVFRPEDSDEDELIGEEDDEATIEIERSMRASPLELPAICSSPTLSHARPKLSRRFSDTDLQSLTLQETAKPPSTSTLDRIVREKRVRPVYDLEKHNDELSAISSSEEDEQMYQQRMYEKQLKKRGEVVKYQPPRRQVQATHFRPRVGVPERNALAEFEYLQDLSSDASGMLSSPDCMNNAHLFKKS